MAGTARVERSVVGLAKQYYDGLSLWARLVRIAITSQRHFYCHLAQKIEIVRVDRLGYYSAEMSEISLFPVSKMGQMVKKSTKV